MAKSDKTTEIWEALRDCIPVLLGVAPFGITCGIMGLTANMSGLEIILMSVFVFAGASQFIAITMLSAGINGWGIVILTTFLVNLRHLIMCSSLASYMIKLPSALQGFLAFFITDEAYALTISRIHKIRYSMIYQLVVSTMIYLVWVLSTVGGVYLGSRIADPLSLGLDFAMPATFLVLLMPMLKDRTSLIVLGMAAVSSVAAALYLPGKWYIVIACLIAVVIGGLSEEDNSYAQ